MKKRILSTTLIAILLIIFLFFGYVGNYYHCTDPKEAVAGTDSVDVKKTDFGYLFDGPGTESCLIFYPGGLVEDIAYADLLKMISASGVDCALVHMPFNLAVFAQKKADRVLSEYDYSSWYIGGHSLGGAMAADYAAERADSFSGLLLLAAYPTKDLSDTSLKVLSIYGSNDGVVNRQRLESARSLMPSAYTEHIIKGGNHGHFGSYGEQSGDGDADISNHEQQEETCQAFVGFETASPLSR